MLGDWFVSGDRYQRSEDGTYSYVGRVDDMLKVGGLWVSPIDMEHVLMEHPRVDGVGVVGVNIDGAEPDRRLSFSARARPATTTLADELQDVVQGADAALRVPAHGALRRRAAAHPDRQGPALPPARVGGELSRRTRSRRAPLDPRPRRVGSSYRAETNASTASHDRLFMLEVRAVPAGQHKPLRPDPRLRASIRSSCSSDPYGSSAPWISSVGALTRQPPARGSRLRNAGSSHTSHQPQNAASGSSWWRAIRSRRPPLRYSSRVPRIARTVISSTNTCGARSAPGR